MSNIDDIKVQFKLVNLERQVNIISRAKMLLESVLDEERNDDYKKIIFHLSVYLLKYCRHNYIDDSVDYSFGEKSHSITYCEKCFTNYETKYDKIL